MVFQKKEPEEDDGAFLQEQVVKSLDSKHPPESIALLDDRGKRIVDCSIGDLGREVLRAFNGHVGIANALKMVHDDAKAGSPTKLNAIRAATRIVEMAAKEMTEEDLRTKSMEDLESLKQAKIRMLRDSGLLEDVIQAIAEKYAHDNLPVIGSAPD